MSDTEVMHRHPANERGETPSRAQIATQIMAGFAACPETDGPPERLADLAVKWTDALLDALAKPTE